MSHPNILVVRPGALGDTILTVPLLASVARHHPGARITFLGSRAYANLVPPPFEFQAADSLTWTWLFGEDLPVEPGHQDRYDIAYLALKRPEAVIGKLHRAGTDLVKSVYSAPFPGIHMVEHLHQGLGLAVPPRAPCLYHLKSREKHDSIWLHPGSGGPAKCAPLELFVTLAAMLHEATGWNILVTLGEDDTFLTYDPLWKTLLEIPGLSVLKNRPLRSLGELLGGVRLFLGNDSGISHLAAGLGIPAAVFFVATDPVQWAPWVPPEQLRIVDLRSMSFDLHNRPALSTALLRLASAS